MSRTYRRTKVKIPRYLYSNRFFEFKADYFETSYSGRLYRPLFWIYNPKELWVLNKKDIVKFRKDSQYDRNAGKWWKQYWASKRRAWDRQELKRFTQHEEYEPIFFTTKIDTWLWD